MRTRWYATMLLSVWGEAHGQIAMVLRTMYQGADNLMWNVEVGAPNKDIYGGDVNGKFGIWTKKNYMMIISV